MPEEAFPRPTRSLSTRVALVSGAGCVGEGVGNGRASAILLAEAGCRVVCVDLSLPLAQRTAEIINTASPAHGKAVAVQADATKAEDCKRAVGTAISEFGRLDILVNVVGVGGATGTAVEVDMAAWAKSMEINVGSMVMMAKFAIPEMEKNVGEYMWRGSIVNIASVAGIRGGNPHLLYPTSKGAVVNMTRAMAVHHAKQGIRVNCVCPGMVYTPMMYAPGMTDEAREARRERSILKTEGTGWDVGAAVRFLAGDEARWMTAVVLPVDAGATAEAGSMVPESAQINPGSN